MSSVCIQGKTWFLNDLSWCDILVTVLHQVGIEILEPTVASFNLLSVHFISDTIQATSHVFI